jgi:hypothetical protein
MSLLVKTIMLTRIAFIARSDDLVKIDYAFISDRKNWSATSLKVRFFNLKNQQSSYSEVFELQEYDDPALCAVRFLKAWIKLAESPGWRMPPAHGDVIPDRLFISPVRGKLTEHHPPLAAATLASHSLRVMRAAGIDTTLIKSHAVRKTVATAQVDLGEDIDVVMQRGRWKSFTVFQQFYNRSKRHTQQCNAVLSLRPAHHLVVPTEPVAPNRLGPPQKRRRQQLKPSQGQSELEPEEDIQIKPVHNDLVGQPTVPEGPGGKVTLDHLCFACEDRDDDSLIWCQACNKHLHVWHFEGDPAEVLAELARVGWKWWCSDCE